MHNDIFGNSASKKDNLGSLLFFVANIVIRILLQHTI